MLEIKATWLVSVGLELLSLTPPLACLSWKPPSLFVTLSGIIIIYGLL